MRALHLPSSLITEEHEQTQEVNQTDWGEKTECSTPSTPGLVSQRLRNISALLPLCVSVSLLSIWLCFHTENMQLWGSAGTWKLLFEMHPSTRLLFTEISDAPPASTRTFCWSESPSSSISHTKTFMSAHFPAQTDERWALLIRKSSLSGLPAAKPVRVRLIRSFDIFHLIHTYASWKFDFIKMQVYFLEYVSSFVGLASPLPHARHHSLICHFPLLISCSLTLSPHFHILLCFLPFLPITFALSLSPPAASQCSRKLISSFRHCCSMVSSLCRGVVGGVCVPAADWSEWDFSHLLLISLWSCFHPHQLTVGLWF